MIHPIHTNLLNAIDARTKAANKELKNYDFGQYVIVVGQDSWDTNERDDLTKVVYVEFLDGRSDSSSMVSFHVNFDKGMKVTEAYGLLMSSGDYIGHRPADLSSRVRRILTGCVKEK